MRGFLAAALAACALHAGAAALAGTPAPEGARLTILSPADGAVVRGPVTVRFGLSGMGVAPAGVEHENTGHHHLVIDAPLPPLDEPIPTDDNHLHFGGGQTEAVIVLPPGPHTLQLLMGDWSHVPHAPPVVSERIAIVVE